MTCDEYVAQFRTLKGDTGYNNAALVEKFEKSLNSTLVDKIYALPEMPCTLDGWILWALKLDRQWRQRLAKKSVRSTVTATVGEKSLSRPAAVSRPFVASREGLSPVQRECQGLTHWVSNSLSALLTSRDVLICYITCPVLDEGCRAVTEG